ncbi:acyl-CoA dehydrogenase family protein [Beijerinckia indica]|uniref:Acyl-CoA dehydrogenase type 2 domain n=1 Tax=Beijerinckia indica subsp. indica (strain ATCC 9039 / DSM 1715 / NCIMB 8712) TaxID=395963 RepID=B2IDP1_BEII9|nr:acyl-CoA dehydrogenase family protein [Beijerinckia indica]ACB95477.1 Acyl-CoA dehydrogenase type 2 domain [Beijerinckia indica subsp. indica ATCC 9039]
MSTPAAVLPLSREKETVQPKREEILSRLPAIAAEIAEDAARRERERELPHDIFRKLRETGLTSLRVPEALGGPGGTMSDQVEIICALAAADSSVAHALRTHFSFVESMAIDPQSFLSTRYAGEVLKGKLFGGAYMEVGTPRPNTIRATIRRNGDHYLLNGNKYYATGTAYADYTSFTALDEEGTVINALIPADREGVHILDDWDGMGQRMSASGGVSLVNVTVYPDETSPHIKANPFVRRHGATRAQLHLAAVIVGIVRNVVSDAIHYVQASARSAKHSASETARGDHFVQRAVGEISAISYALDALIAETARKLDRAAEAIVAGTPDAELDDLVMASALANSKTQIVTGTLASRAAELIFETGGGSATSRTNNFDRHWRNIRTLLNHNPLFLKARVVGDYYLNGTRTDFDEGRIF